jgi:preprotein translocase subunit SecG
MDTYIYYIVFAIHIILCLTIVGLVLLQQGKGADLGAAFSGGSNTIFGASGASSALVKITTVVAILFMISSVVLIKIHQNHTANFVASKSVLEGSVMEQTATSEGQTAEPAAGSAADATAAATNATAADATATGATKAPAGAGDPAPAPAPVEAAK